MKQRVDKLREQIYQALGQRDYEAARAQIRQLAAVEPVEAAGLQTALEIEAGDPAAADDAWQNLHRLSPGAVYTIFLRARIQFMSHEIVEAFQTLAALQGRSVEVPYREKVANLYGQCCRFLGHARQAADSYRYAARTAAEPELAALEYSDYLFNLHYLPTSLTEQRAAAAGYDRLFSHEEGFLHAPREAGQAKLRIGYISPDLRHHVVLQFIDALFHTYDRERFMVYAYAANPEDGCSRQLAAAIDGWRNIYRLSPQEAAQVIYEDKIDILIDLSGHTKGSCLPILACHPAPVQVSGIGYFASTGLREVDYFLSDRYLAAGNAADGFTEKLLVLPQSHFCYTPFCAQSFEGEPACQRNGFITFGSFNNFSKVSDAVLPVWAELLRQLPQARLLLKAEVFDYPDSRNFALERLLQAGLDLDRVECRGLSQEYLREYRDMDIALDTFPYPGGGTTCDALYMGVPVVTMTGDSHGERFGASILQNLGLPELIAATPAEYIACAKALAQDRELLAALHGQLRGRMSHSPLMDAGAYAQDIGQAWETIWQTYVSQQPRLARRDVIQMEYRLRAYEQQRDTQQALAAAAWILESHPRSPERLERLAILAIDAGDISLAQRSCDYLKEAAPERKQQLLWQAEVLAMQQNWIRAEAMARDFLASGEGSRSEQGIAHHLCAEIYKKQGDRARAAESYRRSAQCKDIASGCLAEYSNYLLNLQYVPQDRQLLYEAACAYAELLPPVQVYTHPAARHRHDRLRIGYISPDFRRHVAACFMQCFFQQAERHIFAVYGYMLSSADDVTGQFASQADVWRDLSGCSAAEAAKIIYEDEIDILVDLSGHTGSNALPVLAWRPAPVQISGIGYFATTGLPTVDYFLTDRHTAGSGEERYFVEKLIRLPASHWCYTPLPGMEELPAPAPYRATGFITFGSLNHFDKVTDELLQAWSAILDRVPQSRLLLKSAVFDDEQRRTAAVERMARFGIPAEKLMLEGYSVRYLTTYQQIDIALDTAPYPGGGTTCDALYMGVPVVSLCGSSHHERFGQSLLINAGLDSLCVQSLSEYVEKAVSLAQDKEMLSQLHHVLRRRLQQTAVMDGALYMQDIEEAYREIWQSWQQVHDSKWQILEKQDMTALDKAFAVSDWPEAIRLTFWLSRREGILQDVPRIAAFAYAQSKDHARAARWAAACWQRDPEDEQMMYLLASASEQQGNLLRALQLCQSYFERSEQLLPDIRRKFLQLRAFTAYKLSHPLMADFYCAVYDENPNDFDAYSSCLMSYNGQAVDEAVLFRKHQAYGQLFQQVKEYVHPAARHQHDKLRIGYLSPDFRMHVMFHFYLAMLLGYDHDHFEVYAYSLTKRPDDYTQQLSQLVDVWRDVADRPIAEIAQCIYNDEIDILFDLAGHTANNGLPVLARRPAPVQLSGIGYMATTGLPAVDYFLTDNFMDPVGSNEPYFTEKLLRVSSHLCYAGISDRLPASEGAPVRKRGWILFGIFNDYRKYTDKMLSVWRDILNQLPNAKILFKCQVFFAPAMVDEAYVRFARFGFDMDRVLFEPASVDYMQRYLDVDIALDTYPYTGGGTTCDALYMGVPVVTCCIRRHSTRFSYSILANIGLEELAVDNLAAYAERAVSLAKDQELLDLLHQQLRGMMMQSKVMDMKHYMAELEQFYQQIWQQYKDGKQEA